MIPLLPRCCLWVFARGPERKTCVGVFKETENEHHRGRAFSSVPLPAAVLTRLTANRRFIAHSIPLLHHQLRSLPGTGEFEAVASSHACFCVVPVKMIRVFPFLLSQDQRAEHLGGNGGIFPGGPSGSGFPCLGGMLLPTTWSLGEGRIRG